MNSSALEKTIRKEVDRVWSLPLTIGFIQNTKNAGVVPLGVAEQFSINENGERYIIQCVTHDCSFPGPSGLSVKNRVQQ